MPDFLNPFSGMAPDRKFTPSELTRAIRLAIAAELEAVHLYETQADATDNPLAAEVLRDIANEEKVHAGEFQRLLAILAPDEPSFLAEGAAEVDAMAAGIAGPAEAPAAEAAAPEPTAPPPSIGSLRAQ